MLFNYTYVPHTMEKMQAFIDFIFYEVWCKAPVQGGFELSLFDANDDLKALMESFNYDDTQGGDFFYSHVERIYGLFSNLNKAQIAELKGWYDCNNAIEQICLNNPAISIARYADIKAAHHIQGADDKASLYQQLASFYKGLYSPSLLGLAIVKETIGDIDDHYKAFMAKNTVGKCPFCGITDVLGVNHTKREAYDHYLPKGLYPFNSINFKNLVPACHYCNSSYKTTRDPAFKPKDPAGDKHRRKSFYPFSVSEHEITISISLTSTDVGKLKPDEVQLSFGPDHITEEIGTWRDIYGIEERYKAKCCNQSDGISWANRVLQERHNYKLSVEDMLNAELTSASNQPFSDSNFLKKAFLSACSQAGLFNTSGPDKSEGM